MNEFLKSLQAFGMEGMGTEVEIEAYASSECAEELIELDNIEAMTVAMESMSDAIMEGGLEMQTLALESAGFTLDTASGFTGELSNEAVGNMIKRGYYEVKIQIKKAIQKIWKLILSAVDYFMGSEGRLKSYGKLFKKYNERLRKIHPKEGKDGEDKEVTIRAWNKKGVPGQVAFLKDIGGGSGWIKATTSLVKTTDIKSGVTAISKVAASMLAHAAGLAHKVGGKFENVTDKTSGQAATKNITDMVAKIKGLESESADAVEKYEKEFEENTKDMASDLKDMIKDLTTNMKDVDSDEMNIYTAKDMLLSIGNELESACKKDLKFKKELTSLKKAWDKKTGEWEIKEAKDDETKRITAAVLRLFNKCGSYITAYRLAVSQFYKAVVSNMQGILADMAKVIAKGTNIGA